MDQRWIVSHQLIKSLLLSCVGRAQLMVPKLLQHLLRFPDLFLSLQVSFMTQKVVGGGDELKTEYSTIPMVPKAKTNKT